MSSNSNTRKKERWRKKIKHPESQKTVPQLRREWKTGKRPAPKNCFDFFGETTCKDCCICGDCKIQEKEIERIRRNK